MGLGLLVAGQGHQADAQRLVAARQVGPVRHGGGQQGDGLVVAALLPVHLGDPADQVHGRTPLLGERQGAVQQQFGVGGSREGAVGGAECRVVQLEAFARLVRRGAGGRVLAEVQDDGAPGYGDAVVQPVGREVVGGAERFEDARLRQRAVHRVLAAFGEDVEHVVCHVLALDDQQPVVPHGPSAAGGGL